MRYAQLCVDRLKQCLDARLVGDVELADDAAPPGFTHPFGSGLRTLFVGVPGHGDIRAFACERGGHGLTYA